MSFIKGLYVLSLFNFIGVLGVVTATPLIKPLLNPQKEPTKVEVQESTLPDTPVPTITLITPSSASVAKKTVNTEKPKPGTTSAPDSQPTPSPTADPLAGKCLVFVSGARYNVTEFRNTHGGGDIFQCGTDMTDIFRGEHPDSYLSKMDGYKI